jgi:hypothetical protein
MPNGEELMSRWSKFLIALFLGAAAGLFYGWVVNPVEYVDIPPESLRVDYKTDYVLMVAEAYQVDHDMGLAVRRLARLGSSAPKDIVANALNYALQHDYAPQDLSLFQLLSEDLLTWNPNQEVPTP